MNRHFLQSPAWESYEQLERHKTFWIDGNGYSILAVLKTTPVGNYLYCPYGPALDSAEDLQPALASLSELAQKQKAFFIRIEPTMSLTPNFLQKLGVKKSHDLNPAHTWALDLSPTQDELLQGIESSKVRYWRNYAKKGISIRHTKDPKQINILTDLLKKLGDRNHFTPQDENHLRNQLKAGFATLYVAELDHIPIAAALVYDYEGVRYYAHAAAADEHRKLAAGSILIIQMILDAKLSGSGIYDFWGMTPSTDQNHPWYGFTQYKKSFGGHQIDYAGTWDLPLKRGQYLLYQIMRKLNRLKRKHRHNH